jgi:hypothetical protein
MILRLVDLDLVATPFQLKQVLKPARPNSNPAVSFHHHFHGPNPIPLQKSQFHGCFSNVQWFQLEKTPFGGRALLVQPYCTSREAS